MLATEPRSLQAIDIASGTPVHVPLHARTAGPRVAGQDVAGSADAAILQGVHQPSEVTADPQGLHKTCFNVAIKAWRHLCSSTISMSDGLHVPVLIAWSHGLHEHLLHQCSATAILPDGNP